MIKNEGMRILLKDYDARNLEIGELRLQIERLKVRRNAVRGLVVWCIAMLISNVSVAIYVLKDLNKDRPKWTTLIKL